MAIAAITFMGDVDGFAPIFLFLFHGDHASQVSDSDNGTGTSVMAQCDPVVVGHAPHADVRFV